MIPNCWDALDPNSFISDIQTPIELNMGIADQTVPSSYSKNLYSRLKQYGKTASFYEYTEDNLNIIVNFTEAMQRIISFF